MKKIFLFLLLCIGLKSYAQYFQNYYNEIVTAPPARVEAFSDGLKSRVNFAGGSPTKYYFVGTGYSELSPAPPTGPDARLRFIRASVKGVINANNASQFADVTPMWWESRGKDLCEVDNGAGTGGYVIVGEVNDNPATGAAGIPGGTDWFFGIFNNAGTPTFRERIDIGGGADVARGVIRSVFVPGTYLVCGYSVKGSTTDAVVARINGAGVVIWLRSLNMVATVPCRTTSVAYAYSLCENPATGAIYVCGSVSGHKPAPDTDGLLFALTSSGVPLWQVYHDLGGSADEYHDVKFTSTGNILVCGFSNAVVGGMGLFNDTWLSLFSPPAMPGAAGMIWSFKHRYGGPIQETKGYRVVEGKNSPSTGGIRYYVVGPAYPPGLLPNQMMLEVFGGGVAGGSYHSYPPAYGPLGFDDRFGLDSIEMAMPAPGLAIFSSTLQPPTGPQSDSYLLKTYYNGGTCRDFCTATPDLLFSMPPHILMQFCKDTVRKVKKLKYITYSYKDASICTQKTVACGKNTKAAGEEIKGIEKGEMRLYPNPAMNEVNVEISMREDGNYRIELIDFTGRVIRPSVIHLDEGSSTFNIKVADLPKGIYLLRVMGKDLVLVKSLLKE